MTIHKSTSVATDTVFLHSQKRTSSTKQGVREIQLINHLPCGKQLTWICPTYENLSGIHIYIIWQLDTLSIMKHRISYTDIRTYAWSSSSLLLLHSSYCHSIACPVWLKFCIRNTDAIFAWILPRSGKLYCSTPVGQSPQDAAVSAL
jgi:hypothetical protein